MLALALTLVLAAPAPAAAPQPRAPHGGTYVPPPKPAAPALPAPAVPVPGAGGTPGGAPGGAPTAPGTGGGDGDPSSWSTWWAYEKAGYLRLRDHLRRAPVRTGSDAWFLGHGSRARVEELPGPDPALVRGEVVPALLDVLAHERSDDLLSAALVALAKAGEEPGETRLQGALERFLAHGSQEVAETAAVALGILGSDAAAFPLVELLRGGERGRALVGAREVPERTRAFAAYGLGLVAARAGRDDVRRFAARELVRVLEEEDGAQPDVAVAALLALGLAPLPPAEADGPGAPWTSLEGEIGFVLELLRDGRRDRVVRAHAPCVAARLLAAFPGGAPAELADELADELVPRALGRAREPREVALGCVIALGRMADGDDDPRDRALRAALIEVLEEHPDPWTRGFAAVALAGAAGRPGASAAGGGAPEAPREATRALLAAFGKGASGLRGWAAVAIGVLGRERRAAGLPPPADLVTAVRAALRSERSADLSAACALAAGLLGDLDAGPALLERLDELGDDAARGAVATALGLLGDRQALGPLRAVLEGARYRPRLLEDAAVALGILGDESLVQALVAILADAGTAASQSAAAYALGRVGDGRALPPLLEILRDDSRPDLARAFAAAALGSVVDPERLPWTYRYSSALDYAAAPATLVDGRGRGLLEIL